jgi:hypothetical protein
MKPFVGSIIAAVGAVIVVFASRLIMRGGRCTL